MSRLGKRDLNKRAILASHLGMLLANHAKTCSHDKEMRFFGIHSRQEAEAISWGRSERRGL
jgi:hypothetical protein